jgi:hypothetical protein
MARLGTPSRLGCWNPTRPTGSAGERPKASPVVDPAIVASPAQAQALLGAVARIRPELAAFFGCLYYAALRPEEAIALRAADCYFPDCGWGMLTLTAACPRSAAAWTCDGSGHEHRGRSTAQTGPSGWSRIPPVLAAMPRAHCRCHGTAPDGRLFRGTRGGPLSESVYGRAWHAARALALGPELAATGLARRPLRPAPRRPVPVAERRRPARRGRRPRRAQRHRAAERVRPLLGLAPSDPDHRRALAVLRYLES